MNDWKIFLSSSMEDAMLEVLGLIYILFYLM